MKKTILLSFLVGGLYVSALAGVHENNKAHNNPETDQENKISKKQQKYDFSLFKFISPTKQTKKDTVDHKKKPVIEKRKEEITYEKPRDFLRFSYAS